MKILINEIDKTYTSVELLSDMCFKEKQIISKKIIYEKNMNLNNVDSCNKYIDNHEYFDPNDVRGKEIW